MRILGRACGGHVLRGLIDAVDQSGIDSLEINRSGTRIRIAKTPAATHQQPRFTADGKAVAWLGQYRTGSLRRVFINLVKNGIDYVPYFAIEKVPRSAWRDHSHQTNLLGHFREADFELQNAILDKIADIDLSLQALDLLTAALNDLTDKQRLKVLQVAARNQKRLSPDAVRMIEALCAHADPQISVLARGLVKSGK